MYKFILVWIILPCAAAAQSNLVRNGSFEGDFMTNVPLRHEDMFQREPPEWDEFILTNSDDDEKWLTDSVFPGQPNLPYTPYNNAFFSTTGCGTVLPFDSSANPVMPASQGHFFVGFNSSNDGNREGIQQDLGCILNSGDYTLQYDWARPYNCEPTQFKVFLSEDRDTRRKEIVTQNSNNANTQLGQWHTRIENFNLDLNDNQDMDNDWLVFAGSISFTSDLAKYMYLDNVHLFRYCDYLNRCTATTGQICPIVGAHLPPLDPLTIIGMENVKHLRLKIYNSLGNLVADDTYTNPNGVPNFHLARLDLPIFSASSTYHYEAELTNNCGAVRRSGSFTVLDTALYDPSPIWVDSTANWSEVPVPCCLHTLTLQNMQIVGDVSYIVRDQITVQGGVSVAPGSHVILQAGNVVELDSVEFDGTNSIVEILEVPCPNRMSSEAGCSGEGTVMVIDAGNIVQPSGNSLPALLDPPTKPFIESPAGIISPFSLWANPNPFHDQIELGITLDEEANCSLRILDLQMRPVKVILEDKLLGKGTHFLLEALNVNPAGTYLVELRAGERTLHVRVIKI
jgi:hypothetical protein